MHDFLATPVKIISHGILILIEWSKVQCIKKWIILVIRLMKCEDFLYKVRVCV